MTPTRILLACSPKSGSTYVSRILARYFQVSSPPILPYYGYREQNLEDSLFTPAVGDTFVLQLHIKPFFPHRELFFRQQLQVIFLWRNLADTLLSLDDHLLNEDIRTAAVYIDNEGDYRRLSRDGRHRFLIDHAAPWYISFYLQWRRIDPPECRIKVTYEQMVGNSFDFFSRIIEAVAGNCDQQRLQDVISERQAGTRFNQGVIGRSVTLMSDENKTRLEGRLLEHPNDLTALLNELPWRSGFENVSNPTVQGV